jgi:hypothetical protein
MSCKIKGKNFLVLNKHYVMKAYVRIEGMTLALVADEESASLPGRLNSEE